VRPEFCPRCLLREAAGTSSAGTPATPSVRQLGDYDLLEEIARGGMGIVFRARQRSLGRIVAVKILLGGHFADATARARFQEEAAAAAALQHPNIVAIHEIGDHEGLPYFSMDYIEGQTLAQLVRDGPLPPHRAAGYVALIAEAIEYGHRQGVLHRDLKPSNVLVDAFDQPRVTDFGLAKRTSGSTPDITLTGQMLGTPAYAAPEQAGRTGAVGPGSDVYSLGALLYHLITGRSPFQGDTIDAILRQVASEEPVAPRRLNPSISRDLETICLKCLEKEATRRYASAGDLARDLERFLAGEPVLARPVGPLFRLWRWSQRHRSTAALVGTLIVVLASIAIGSTIFAGRIARAEHEAVAALRKALLNEARALRLGGNVLARDEILNRIEQARSLGLEPEELLRARSEAASALALPHVTHQDQWSLPPDASPESFWFDPGTKTRFEIVGTNQVRVTSPDGAPQLLNTGTNTVLGIETVTPNLEFLALRHVSGIGLWSTRTGMRVFQGTRSAGAVAFAPNNRVAIVEDANDALLVVELPSGRLRTRALVSDPIPNGDSGWFNLATSPDGTVIAGGRVRTNVTDVLSAEDGRHLTRLSVGEPMTACAWHPNSPMVATGTRGGRLLLWRYPSLEPDRWTLNFVLPSGGVGAVESLAFEGTGRFLAAGSSSHTLQVTDLQTRRLAFQTPGLARGLQFQSSGNQLGPVIDRGRFRQVQFRKSEFLADRELAVLRGDVLGIDLESSAPLAAVFAYSRGVLLHPRAGSELSHINTAGTRALRLHPSGSPLLGVDSRGVSRWEITEPSPETYQVGERWTIVPGRNWAGLAFNRDGSRMALASPAAGRATLFDDTLTNRLTTVGPHPGTDAVALSPDARWLATASPQDRRIRIWDTATGKRALERIAGRRPSGTFSNNGEWFIGTGFQPQLLSTADWSARPLPGLDADSEAQVVAFSPDSTLLAVVTGQHEIQLFRLPELEPVLILHAGFPSRITALAIAVGNGSLMIGGNEGSIRTWKLDLLRTGLQRLHLDWSPAPAPAVAPNQTNLRVRMVSQPR
jgi:WD40 repeat protein